jgi:F420H(2)-dependent biliverdin reductase
MSTADRDVDVGDVARHGDRGARLHQEQNVWLCTVRDDGSPHLTPIWFVFVDDAFWLCTGAGTVKTRNVQANPLVALGLEDGNHPVVIEGHVTVHATPYPQRIVDGFLAKYGWDISRTDDPDGPFDALWQVSVRRWLLGGPDA